MPPPQPQPQHQHQPADDRETLWDLVIIGAGMGGSALVSRFCGSGLKIVLLERGEYLKPDAANWSPREVISAQRYESGEPWEDDRGRPFQPRVYYNVGGNSKFFGGSAFRYRESDFQARQLPGGSTAPWPLSCSELAPWYDKAERAMMVHGAAGADPCEPPRSPYPHPPVTHEPEVQRLADRLRRLGLRPFPLPMAVDQGPGGRCRKGSPCDGFPCRIRAKGDGENAFLRPALKADPGITLHTGIRVTRIIHSPCGKRVEKVQAVNSRGEPLTYRCRTLVLAAGAADSAIILLRSSSPLHPRGLSNSSGLVGRCFMSHNNSVLMALNPFRKNPTQFQKTLALHDFYSPDNRTAPGASGNIQMRGKIRPENLERHPSRLVRLLRRAIAARSMDFWIMSEDLPLPENRIELRADGGIRLHRRPSNLDTHRRLVRHFRRILKRCGFPLVLVRKPRLEAVQHQCGTIRFGTRPAESVLDKNCRSWEVENLYVCDASVFPSAAAVNPALTVAANALRVGDIILAALKPPNSP